MPRKPARPAPQPVPLFEVVAAAVTVPELNARLHEQRMFYRGAYLPAGISPEALADLLSKGLIRKVTVPPSAL